MADNNSSYFNSIINVSYKFATDDGRGTEVVKRERTLSNMLTLPIAPNNIMNVTVAKLADKKIAALGETVNYTMLISNSGNIDLKDIVIKDTIDINTIYVKGTGEVIFVNNSLAVQKLLEYETEAEAIESGAAGVYSYIIVPKYAEISCPSVTQESDRDLFIHLNEILKPGNVAVVKFSVKINGEENDINGYSINNPCNVQAYNANNIINKMGIGYDASKDGTEIPEYHRDVPKDLSNPTDEEKTRISSAETTIEFSKLIASKDIFKLDNGQYVNAYNEDLKCGDEICYLITLKNYGNIDANNVQIYDSLENVLEFTGYNPSFIDDMQLVLNKEDMLSFTTKAYDPNNPDANPLISDYTTGGNNRNGEIYLTGYPCASEYVAERAINKEIAEGNTVPYGILVENNYIKKMNITVPARLINGEIKVENYDKTLPQADTINDDVVGIYEFRLYYTIKY